MDLDDDRRFTAAWPRLWAARDFGRFTTSVWGARTIYVCSANADFLLVGRFLGSDALGFYGMAWDLLRFVPDRLHEAALMRRVGPSVLSVTGLSRESAQVAGDEPIQQSMPDMEST